MTAGGPGFHVGGDVGANSFNGSLNTSFNVGPWGPPERARSTDGQTRVDVGVLTVLPQETRAMTDVFRRATDYGRQTRATAVAHEATFTTEQGPVGAVLMQTLDRGQRSATAAYANLRHWYRPRVVALVGIAGGISERLDVGDVVIANQVVHYDERRESHGKVDRRGESTLVSPGMKSTLNHLFSTYGEPFALADGSGVLSGPIGTGGAVVTDSGSEIRAYLRAFNEKCLAVETEAGGLVQAVREDHSAAAAPVDWLVIRAISDHADADKGDRDHDLASRHAAAVFALLLPFLADRLGGVR